MALTSIEESREAHKRSLVEMKKDKRESHGDEKGQERPGRA